MNKPWLGHYDPGVPSTIDYPGLRVFDFLELSAQRWPDRTALLGQDHLITYSELRTLVNRLADSLRSWGLRKGERVSLMLPNCPQFVLAYYAVLKAGGIVSAINPNYTPPELEFQIRNSSSELLIAIEQARPTLEAVRARLQLRDVLWTQPEDATAMASWIHAKESPELCNLAPGDSSFTVFTLKGFDRPDNLPEVTPDDPAVFQYSGGTTGTPKAAVGLHKNLVANTLQFRYWLTGLKDGEETALLTIPLYHVYGMVVGMSVGMMLGARMILNPNPRDFATMLDSIEKHQVSFFPGVPTLYALINQFPAVRQGLYNLSTIKACICGSAPLPEGVRMEFERLSGAKLMEGYGLSEAPTATHCNPMLGEKRTGSIGLPLPDVDCKIISLTDPATALPPGEIGELVLRGPQVMREYHQMPEETAQAIRDGWLHTGDTGKMDSDGYFYILDRLKDLVKVSGYQVWPREIEEVLGEHPGVLEAGVTGIPDMIKGEVVKAWVVLRPGLTVSESELIEWCKRSLVYYKVPERIEFCDRLPRSGVGKLLRRKLQSESNVIN